MSYLNTYHLRKWQSKVTYEYLHSKAKENEEVNMSESYGWLKSENLSSYIEGYLFSLQEQEVNTKAAQRQREKDPSKKQNINISCRLCKHRTEDLFHVLSSCSSMSDNMYLHHRHDRVAKVIYEELVSQNYNEKGMLKHRVTPPSVTHIDGKEIWWNTSVKLPNKVEHSRLDLIVWNTDAKLCTSMQEVCIPLDTNVTLRSTWKENFIYH